MAERHISFEQLSDIMAFRVDRADRRGLLPRARASSTGAGRWCRGGSRITSRPPSATAIARSTPRVIHADNTRVEIQIRTARDARARPNSGSPRTGRTRQGKVRARHAASAGSATWSRSSTHAESPEELLEHTRMAMYQDRIFAFTPEGRADPAAQGRDADRLRLCGPHRSRRPGGRRQDQRPRRAAAHRASRMATRSRSCAPRRRSRSRAGSTSRSPARRAPRSAATCATRSATRRRRSAARCIAIGRKEHLLVEFSSAIRLRPSACV